MYIQKHLARECVCQQRVQKRDERERNSCRDESSLREKSSFCHATATFNKRTDWQAAKVKPLCGIHLSCNLACIIIITMRRFYATLLRTHSFLCKTKLKYEHCVVFPRVEVQSVLAVHVLLAWHFFKNVKMQKYLLRCQCTGIYIRVLNKKCQVEWKFMFAFIFSY